MKVLCNDILTSAGNVLRHQNDWPPSHRRGLPLKCGNRVLLLQYLSPSVSLLLDGAQISARRLLPIVSSMPLNVKFHLLVLLDNNRAIKISIQKPRKTLRNVQDVFNTYVFLYCLSYSQSLPSVFTSHVSMYSDLVLPSPIDSSSYSSAHLEEGTKCSARKGNEKSRALAGVRTGAAMPTIHPVFQATGRHQSRVNRLKSNCVEIREVSAGAW